MKDFIYDIGTRVYFGKDQLQNVGTEVKSHGNRVLLVYGGGSIKRSGLYDKVMASLKDAGLTVFELPGIDPNPRIQSVRDGVAICKKENIDVVLAVGGGSSLDAAKVICAGAVVDHDPWDFLGAKRLPVTKALPLVTILTLAATGSEMDMFAVISNPDTQEKIGLGAKPLVPKASFLDPTLTYSVSKYQTACGSADMMSHLMETYFNSNGSMYMLDSMMESLMRTIIRYAPIALREPDNYEARANLMWTSSWAINGFVRSCQQCAWSCHPMEHELSAIYDITHGLGLAILTPRWMTYCLDESNVDRLYNFAVNVFGIVPSKDRMAVAKQGIAALSHFFFHTLELDDTFTKAGIRKEDFPEMARKACGGATINGFKTLAPKDVEAIFEMCL